MKFNEEVFNRDVDYLLEETLFSFVKELRINGLDFRTSVKFSKFISLSASFPYDRRYSISQLSQIFNSYQLPTSELLKIYMIALLCFNKDQRNEFIW